MSDHISVASTPSTDSSYIETRVPTSRPPSSPAADLVYYRGKIHGLEQCLQDLQEDFNTQRRDALAAIEAGDLQLARAILSKATQITAKMVEQSANEQQEIRKTQFLDTIPNELRSHSTEMDNEIATVASREIIVLPISPVDLKSVIQKDVVFVFRKRPLFTPNELIFVIAHDLLRREQTSPDLSRMSMLQHSLAKFSPTELSALCHVLLEWLPSWKQCSSGCSCWMLMMILHHCGLPIRDLPNKGLDRYNPKLDDILGRMYDSMCKNDGRSLHDFWDKWNYPHCSLLADESTMLWKKGSTLFVFDSVCYTLRRKFNGWDLLGYGQGVIYKFRREGKETWSEVADDVVSLCEGGMDENYADENHPTKSCFWLPYTPDRYWIVRGRSHALRGAARSLLSLVQKTNYDR